MNKQSINVGYSLLLAKRLELRIMKRWMPLNNGYKVCDVGCGMGMLDSIMYRNSFRIYVVDFDEERIKLARIINRGKANDFGAGDADAGPLNSFF